ncbi:MAG: DUF89 family protein [Candidatus Thorarchaeota archaeon]|nr:MAG: DUF89 family protein [Candidatus Thorarchaeota archaeon]
MSRKRIEVPLVSECSACIMESLDTLIPMLTEDSDERYELYRLALKRLSEGFGQRTDPLTLSVTLYRELYEKADVEDPYKHLKDLSNEAAKKVIPDVIIHVEAFAGYERLRAALASSIAGNIIDFNTAGHEPDLEGLESVYRSVLEEGFHIDDSKAMWTALNRKKGRLLILGDNAGETLFDLPLIRLSKELGWTVIYAIKEKAMVNDATIEDLKGTEIEELAAMISTGAWAHGVPLKWVSKEFLNEVSKADLVISKGQANIESFPEIQRELSVETYYVTRAKCPHISRAIGAAKGYNVVLMG